MAVTIRLATEELNELKKGFFKTVGKDAWYKMGPFHYRLNEHGTLEVYDDEELKKHFDINLRPLPNKKPEPWKTK